MLLSQQTLHLLSQFLAQSAVSRLPVLVVYGIPLGSFPYILATASSVAPELARDGGRVYANCFGDGTFRLSFL